MTKGDDCMEIKEFKEITIHQKKELYNFIKNTNSTYNKTYIEMTKTYESDTFNKGGSVFILVDNYEVKGSLAIITKEISIKGEAFITDIYITKENIERNLCFLIEEAITYCNNCSARSVKVGLRESETHLIPYINKLEFSHIYDAVIMRYKGDKDIVLKSNKKIELVDLSTSNSKQYMNIQNEAFINSPNGGTIDQVEVMDYIVKYANNQNLIGLCCFETKPCGMYELSLDAEIGWIDTLAVSPECQKKGIGKLLLMSCIERLWEKNVEVIKLLVITSNEIAVKMYKENGFEEEAVFSYWFEKTLT
jgi:ribosomal protein S18 acetylase RimI-like enzyme